MSDVSRVQADVPSQHTPFDEAQEGGRADAQEAQHDDSRPHASDVVALLGVEDEPADSVGAPELFGDHEQEDCDRHTRAHSREDPRADGWQNDPEKPLPESDTVTTRRFEHDRVKTHVAVLRIQSDRPDADEGDDEHLHPQPNSEEGDRHWNQKRWRGRAQEGRDGPGQHPCPPRHPDQQAERHAHHDRGQIPERDALETWYDIRGEALEEPRLAERPEDRRKRDDIGIARA